MNNRAYVRIQSHRHRRKIIDHLGRCPPCYFSFFRYGNWFLLSLEEIASLRNSDIKATVARKTDDLRECFSWL